MLNSRLISHEIELEFYFVNKPRQRRSQATADRLVAAAERLAAQRSLAAISVADLLRDARVSAGSFYARFDSKDALIRHLGDRFWTRARAGWAERLDPGRWIGRSAAVILERVVREMVLAYRRQWGELRGLIEYGLAHPDTRLLKQAREHDGVVIRLLRDLLLARRDEIRHPDPAVAVEIGYLQLAGALRTLILIGWPKTDLAAVPDDTLIAQLTRSFARYLDLKRRAPQP